MKKRQRAGNVSPGPPLVHWEGPKIFFLPRTVNWARRRSRGYEERKKRKRYFSPFHFGVKVTANTIQLVNFVPRAKTQRNTKSTENKDEILLLFLVLFFLPPSLLYHRFDRCSVLLFRGTDRRRNRVIDRLREQRRCFKLWNETID